MTPIMGRGISSHARRVATHTLRRPVGPAADYYAWWDLDPSRMLDASANPADIDEEVYTLLDVVSGKALVNVGGAGTSPTRNALGMTCDNNDYLRLDAYGATLTQPNTVIIALKAHETIPASWRYICEGGVAGTARHGVYQISVTGIINLYAGSTWSTAYVLPDTNWHVLLMEFNGATSYLWCDGVEVAGPGNVGTQALDGATYAARFNGATPWWGSMGDMLVYDRVLSVADKAQTFTYLKSKYGVA